MNREDDGDEVILTGTHSIYQAVGQRTQQAERDGRMIHVEPTTRTTTTALADATVLGKRVYKNFMKHGWHFGTVIAVNYNEEKTDEPFFYTVRYDDDDEEDYTREVLEELLQNAERNAASDPKTMKKPAKKKNTPASSRTVVAAAAAASAPDTPLTPVRVKRERGIDDDDDGVAVVTPPPSKKKTAPPRFQSGMWASDIPWVRDFTDWIITQNMSVGNARSVLRQVTKLAKGEGVGYKGNWPDHVFYCKDRPIDLYYDFDEMTKEARRYEDTYGEDKGHGWLTRHPIKKLKLYQDYLGIHPTKSIFE